MTKLGDGLREVRISARTRDFSLFQNFQTGSGAQPATYTMDTWALSPRVKRSGREPDNSSPSSVEIKMNTCISTLHLPLHSFARAWRKLYLLHLCCFWQPKIFSISNHDIEDTGYHTERRIRMVLGSNIGLRSAIIHGFSASVPHVRQFSRALPDTSFPVHHSTSPTTTERRRRWNPRTDWAHFPPWRREE